MSERAAHPEEPAPEEPAPPKIWQIRTVATVERLALLLTDQPQVLCAGFQVAGFARHLFLNTSAQREGLQSYDLLFGELSASVFVWMASYEIELRSYRSLKAFWTSARSWLEEQDPLPLRVVPAALETPQAHWTRGTCPYCRSA